MNDDYLWNKSGEPDPETERLEQLLGKFHYQPQPLNLPLDLPVTPARRVLSPSLAAAAAVALVAVAVGVWLNWQASKEEAATPVATATAPEERREQKGVAVAPQAKTDAETVQAINQKPRRRAPHYQREESQSGLVKASGLTEEERAAKAKLMLALHIASSKLNLAQKKIHADNKPTPRS